MLLVAPVSERRRREMTEEEKAPAVESCWLIKDDQDGEPRIGHEDAFELDRHAVDFRSGVHDDRGSRGNSRSK